MYNDDTRSYVGTATIWFKSNNVVYLLTAAHCVFKWNSITNKMEKPKRMEISFNEIL